MKINYSHQRNKNLEKEVWEDQTFSRKKKISTETEENEEIESYPVKALCMGQIRDKTLLHFHIHIAIQYPNIAVFLWELNNSHKKLVFVQTWLKRKAKVSATTQATKHSPVRVATFWEIVSGYKETTIL